MILAKEGDLVAIVQAVIRRSVRSQSDATAMDVAIRAALREVMAQYGSDGSITAEMAVDIVVARVVRRLQCDRNDSKR